MKLFFFCWFSLCNTKFLTKHFISSYMYVASYVNFSSKFVTKKYHLWSGNFTSYFTSKWIWLKFNLVHILVLPFRFLQRVHIFLLDQGHYNWIIHVHKCSIFTSVILFNSKCLIPYMIQPVPIPFYNPDQYPFPTVAFPDYSIIPQY